MKDKVQKLCKRLNKFTLDEIAFIAESDESDIKIVLDTLLKQRVLRKHGDIYIYIEKKKSQEKNHIPLIFQYHSQETIDMIIKCFCAELTITKTCLIMNLSEDCISKFNLCFRKLIYNIQLNELKNFFRKKPQQYRMRKFFGIPMYFYYYNEKLYVSSTPLKEPTGTNSVSFTQNEVRKFKTQYSRLTRVLNHNKNKEFLEYKIAERICRADKNFEEFYDFLKKSLFD